MARQKISQFAVKQETTPGTAVTPDATNVLVKHQVGYAFDVEVERVPLDLVSSVDSLEAPVVLRKMQRFDVTYPLIGPGDLVTTPAVAPMFEAALFDGAAAKTITIGAVTSGPFLAGEIITDESSHTGMVLQDTADGDTSLPYLPISGTLTNTETLTGSVSGATATAGSTPSDNGYAFRPATWSSGAGHHCSCWGIIGGSDGKAYKGRGCLADLRFELSDGGPCMVSQTFQGHHSGHADQAAFTLSSGYPEDGITVPQHKASGMLWNSETPVLVGAVSISVPTGLQPVTDTAGSDADGVAYMGYDKGAPTISFPMQSVLVATYDWETDLKNGTTRSFELTFGSSAGTKWRFAAPAAQLQSLTPIEIGGVAGYQVEIACFGMGPGNNELLIHQH